MCRGKGKKGCKKTKNAAKKNGRARKKDSAKRGGKPPRTRKGNNGNKPNSDRRQSQRKKKTKKNKNRKKNTDEVKAKENEQKFSGGTTGQGRQITGNATSCAMKAIKYARLFEGKATSIFRQVGILNISMM